MPKPCAANVSVIVESVATGAAVPVPLNVAACGLPGASSVTSSEAESGPAAVGVNVTSTVHAALAAKVAPQVVLVLSKSVLEPASVIAIPEIFTVTAVEFVTVTVISDDVDPTASELKFTTAGDTM